MRFTGEDFESAHEFVSSHSNLIPDKLLQVAIFALVSLPPGSRSKDSVRRVIANYLDGAIDRAFNEISRGDEGA